MSDDQPTWAGLPRRTLKIAVPTIAALGAGSAFAIAAIPSSDGSITGCYETQTANASTDVGVLRVIPATSECHNDEAAISWNQQGPTGPGGQQGQGGPTGPAGQQGQKGDQGVGGAPGAPGAQGAKGDPGETPTPTPPPTPTPTPNAVLFLSINGIAGTAVAPGHKGDLPIEAFNWGASTGSPDQHGNRRLTLADFSVRREMDASSPKLFDAVVKAKDFRTAKVTEFAPSSEGKGGGTTYEYALTDVTIVRIQATGPGGPTSPPAENLVLQFTKIKVSVTDVNGQKTSSTFRVTSKGKLVRVR
jgi:type VI protein secretion system component Hcp